MFLRTFRNVSPNPTSTGGWTATTVAGVIPLLVLFAGCSSLKRSQVDRQMRIQGAYYCPPQQLARPAGENPDATVVRCYQDSVTVQDAKVEWRRVFYAAANCQEDGLGFGRWDAAVQGLVPQDQAVTEVRMAVPAHYEITRNNADWFYDAGGKCDLRQYKPAQAFPITPGGNCHKLFPSSRKDEGPLLLSGGEREGTPLLKGRWGGESHICSR